MSKLQIKGVLLIVGWGAFVGLVGNIFALSSIAFSILVGVTGIGLIVACVYIANKDINNDTERIFRVPSSESTLV